MSYLAIARKWRPLTFDDVAGQGHVTRTLNNAIELGRIHHAFLFTGPRGVGKTTAARILARALNCDNGPTPTPCDHCPNCTDILAGSSPDVIEIDGASNNSVEDVRTLRDGVKYMPAKGRHKIYIVDEVHMLSKGAFNALLKTLEEPPPHVVFMFATTEPNKIPETILSRVQRFDFKRIPGTVVVDHLRKICQAEGVEIPDAGLRLLARAGEGSMRDSQSLLDQVFSFGGRSVTVEQIGEILGLVDRKVLYDMLRGMLTGDIDACLDAIAAVDSYGHEFSQFTAEMLELLRNAALVALSPKARRYLDVSDEERAALEQLASDVPAEVFVRSFDVMLELHDAVARAPVPRLVLEMATARLTCIRPARPVESLIGRLEDLERRLQHGGGPAPRSGGGPVGGGSERPRSQPPEPSSRGGGRYQVPGPGQQAAPPAPAARPAPAPVERPIASRYSAPRDGGERPVAPSTEVPPDPEPPPGPPPAPVDALPASEPAPIAPLEPAVERVTAPAPVDSAASPGEDEATTREEPPILGPDATNDERFVALLKWLRAGGVEYDVWGLESALKAVEPPVLHVVFAGVGKAKWGRDRERDPRLVRGLAACFPGCSSLRIDTRDAGDRLATQREIMNELERQRREDLKVEMSRHPLVLKACQQLGASVGSVTDDPPREEFWS